MLLPDDIRIKDFDYPLSAERIAQFPLPVRDDSKLLVYKDGMISRDVFSNIHAHLPHNSLLVFNNTRVIHARLLFEKATGGQVEIFCLEPLSPVREIQAAFRQEGSSTWKCLVGNSRRWKSGTLAMECRNDNNVFRLFANRQQSVEDGCFEIAFSWEPADLTFAEILGRMGKIPLPPYITRPAGTVDRDRYQTIYAEHDGSVAAPTAGLHFTTPVLERVRAKGISTINVTLHVGVGTFRPVTAENIRDHTMHHEQIVVQTAVIELLLRSLSRRVFAIGTTSARTLESLYWLGVRILREGPGGNLAVTQWEPYQPGADREITAGESLEALLNYLNTNHLKEYSGETRLMIVPGYRFRVVSGMVTNFHMPQSTLLLLVAAMIGGDWRTAYEYALQNGFRFLSYGDSCLFFSPCP
jgi:S-adenosylmethionine:tRNA ribosyltransferase-isomerase